MGIGTVVWAKLRMRAAATVCCAAGVLAASVAHSQDPMAPAEAALRKIQAGDMRGAALVVRRALDQDPGDPLLHNLAATLLLMTGDTKNADRMWKVCLADNPQDGLASYGMALTCLARGDEAGARTYLRRSEPNGDRAFLLLADRYLERVRNGGSASLGIALPEPLAAGAHAMDGLVAAKRGDHRTAFAELTAALNALPGDPFAEAPGLVMTFDPARPIGFGCRPLPSGMGLAPSVTVEPPLSGTVMLSPDLQGAGVGFVSFRIDGAFTCIVNAPPFRYAWDTTRYPNSLHNVEMLVFDQQGNVIQQTRRRIRTSNAGAPPRPPGDEERIQRLRTMLWNLLALYPSKAVVADAAAQEAHILGDSAAATRYASQAAAIDPARRKELARFIPGLNSAAEAALWRGDPRQPVVALTFDDGPKPGITEQLLAVLTREHVPATFFVIGRHATAHPDLIRKMAAAGMEIENHTYTHPNLTLLPERMVEEELMRTMAAVTLAGAPRNKFFRPPGGNLDASVTRIAAKCGLTPCLWTLDADALENGSPARLVEYVVQKAEPGAIILMHNGRLTTVDALPAIISGLRAKGLGFVTVDHLMAKPELAAKHPATAAAGTRSIKE
ncbi:MAG: polysaccharide deacetylase family protein [Chthonomonadales bacterium]